MSYFDAVALTLHPMFTSYYAVVSPRISVPSETSSHSFCLMKYHALKVEEDEDIGICDAQAAILEAKIDPVEWKRELERVGPKMKVRSDLVRVAASAMF